ncbi:response regulator [Bradyrhizobium sp. 4]|uniref:response regulator n=1 Tax=unclassified Bradyrhizobium TaxID=2631580 RepID=UPI001FF82186|nr:MULTISPECIES: response regulator [unclassified Bradyrhizobium]MCK1401286.1 response regulator [Bradyrhizobium sp. 39]MCK1752907.1 response regulator [Bradyrhizobium sp. 135]UPJ37099.1 response regulator [Bradyrhizobium sp. 4]
MAAVLLIEDETLIRMMIADMLMELGHEVAGEASDLGSGLAMAMSAECDAAILDLQLGRDSSEAIAEALQLRGIPFVFASGYGVDGVPEQFNGRPLLQKPFPLDALDRCMGTLLGQGSNAD